MGVLKEWKLVKVRTIYIEFIKSLGFKSVNEFLRHVIMSHYKSEYNEFKQNLSLSKTSRVQQIQVTISKDLLKCPYCGKGLITVKDGKYYCPMCGKQWE